MFASRNSLSDFRGVGASCESWRRRRAVRSAKGCSSYACRSGPVWDLSARFCRVSRGELDCSFRIFKYSGLVVVYNSNKSF